MCICFLRDISHLCSHFIGELVSSYGHTQTLRLGHVALLESHFPGIALRYGRRNTNVGGKVNYLCHTLCPLPHKTVRKCHMQMESTQEHSLQGNLECGKTPHKEGPCTVFVLCTGVWRQIEGIGVY